MALKGESRIVKIYVGSVKIKQKLCCGDAYKLKSI
jgi:hypothetical protein